MTVSGVGKPASSTGSRASMARKRIQPVGRDRQIRSGVFLRLRAMPS